MTPIVRWLGCVEYEPTWRAMQRFTEERGADTADELWCLSHPPVFTLGMNADSAHVISAGDIPVVQTDRGGQVTYHGPGQLVIYPLIDLRRTGFGIRDLVSALESALIALLAAHGQIAVARRDAPGVYVAGAKVASIGLRIRRGACYHGLALNVSMDLAPFMRINPCGDAGLLITDLTRLGIQMGVAEAARQLVPLLCQALGLSGDIHAQLAHAIASDA